MTLLKNQVFPIDTAYQTKEDTGGNQTLLLGVFQNVPSFTVALNWNKPTSIESERLNGDLSFEQIYPA